MGGEAAAQSADPYPPQVADPSSADEGLPELQLDGEAWRHEIAARLQRYRSRRKPRAPRYPSLCLPFDGPENRPPMGMTSTMPGGAAASALAVEPVLEADEVSELDTPPLPAAARIIEEATLYSNVIEFPRVAAAPVYYGNELAEPVLDRPRIVEAPEVLPPPPAMGGILIEGATEPAAPSASSAFPLPVASLGRRFLASLLDGLILLVALAAFGGMFWWVNPQRPPLAPEKLPFCFSVTASI